MNKDVAVIVGFYFAVLLGWSLFNFIRNMKKGGETAESAYVGDRSYGTAPTLATLVASWASHYTILASSESGFLHGISGPVWYAVACVIPIFFFVWPINLVKKIRDALPNGVTIIEFLGKRYDHKTQSVSLIVILLSSILYVISTVMAIGIVLSSLLNIKMDVAIMIGGVVLILYTALGGFSTLIWGHAFQIVVAGLAVFVTLFMVVTKVGLSDFISRIPSEKLNIVGWGPIGMFDFFLGLLAFTIANPIIWQRIFSAKSSKSATRALIWFGPTWATFAVGTGLMGMIAFLIMPGVDPSQSATLLVVDILPIWAAVIFLLGSMALIFSSGDSAINNIASIVQFDIIKKYFKKEFTSKQNLYIGFLLQITLGVIGIIGALKFTSVLDLIILNGLINLALLFPLYLGVVWKNAHPNAAFWSIIASLGLGMITISVGPIANLSIALLSLFLFLTISYFYIKRDKNIQEKGFPITVKGLVLIVVGYTVAFFLSYLMEEPVLKVPVVSMYPLYIYGLVGTLGLALILPFAIMKDRIGLDKRKSNDRDIRKIH